MIHYIYIYTVYVAFLGVAASQCVLLQAFMFLCRVTGFRPAPQEVLGNILLLTIKWQPAFKKGTSESKPKA